jgi:hypothetical protein
MIQAQLEARLPSLIQDGLSQQLPALIQGRVGDLVAQGGTDASIRAALPNIIAELLQQLVPQIISRGMPDLLQQGLEGQLPAEITVRLQAQLPDILSHSSFPDDVKRLVKDQTTGLPDQVNINDTDRQTATNQITTGVTQVAQQSIAQSNGTQQLAQEMARVLTERLLPVINAQLVPHISQSVGNFTSGGNQTITSLIGRIPGAGGGLIQSLNIESGILQPMSNEIARSLSSSVGTSIREFQINNVLQDAPFLSDGELASELGDIRGVNAYVDGAGNFVGYSYLGDTFGQDASSAVNAASGQIAGQATNGFNFGSLGTSLSNSLKSGLAGGLSGGLAGLVNGIPYAGPLLAPIVQQLTQEVLNQVLNIGGGGGVAAIARAESGAAAAAAGIPFGNAGLGQVGAANVQATYFGFLQSNMNTGQIAGNTHTSNENEKQIIDLDTRIKTLEKQACTYTKIIKRITLAMEEKEFVLDPNARKAAFLTLQKRLENFMAYLKIGFKVSPGLTGTTPAGGEAEGSSLINKNLGQDVNDAQKEAGAINADITSKSGNIHKAEVVKALNQTAATTYTDSIKSTITQAEYQALATDPASLSDAQYNELKEKAADPRNNQYGSYLLALAKQESDKAAAAQETKDTFIANQGYKPVRYCDPKDMIAIPMRGVFCARWQTLTPGSTVKDYGNKLLTGLIDFLIDTRENVEDFVIKASQGKADPERTIMGLDEIPGVGAEGPAPLTSNSDTCPSPGPCPNSGWQPQQQSAPSPFQQANTASPSFSDRLGQQLEQGLTSGLGNLINQGFNLSQNSLSRLTNSLRDGVSNAHISGNENPLELQFIIQGIAEIAVHNNPDIIEDDQAAIIQFIVNLLINLLQNR